MEAKFLAKEMKELGPQIRPKEGSCLCQRRKKSDKENSQLQQANRQTFQGKERKSV